MQSLDQKVDQKIDQQVACQMGQRGWMFFDLILKCYHPRDSAMITKLLTQDEQQHCQVKAPPSQLSDWLISSAAILSTIHPQWIVDAIKTLEEKRHASILAALPEGLCKSVCQLGKWQEPALHIRPNLVHPILQDLLRLLQDSTYLPLSALPKGSLSPLLDLPSEQLIRIADGMGLRDLAEVVRGNVEKKFLHSIYSCLSPQEQTLLRSYVQQKERLKSAPLVLKGWDGKKETLRALYHERGLIRMARALYGQSENFLWHLFHRFSPQEAKRLKQQMHQREPQAAVTTLLMQQLLGVMEFLQRQST